MTIDELDRACGGIQTRLYNQIKATGVQNVEELCEFSATELLKSKVFGASSLLELQEALYAVGKSLRKIRTRCRCDEIKQHLSQAKGLVTTLHRLAETLESDLKELHGKEKL